MKAIHNQIEKKDLTAFGLAFSPVTGIVQRIGRPAQAVWVGLQFPSLPILLFLMAVSRSS
jgi:hypothetical protein